MKASNTFADFMPPTRARFEGKADAKRRSEPLATGGSTDRGQLDSGDAHSMSFGHFVGAPLERPITQPDQDVLGRVDLVTRLARSLVAPDGLKARGVAVGITGDWGCGKTSFLNLLDYELNERRPRPIVVRFDPWLVQSGDALVPEFFAGLVGALQAERRFKDQTARAIEAVQGYATHWARSGDAGRTAVQDGPGLVDRRQAVAEALAQIEVPIIILVDELDRLDPSMVLGLARLIRGIADFEPLSYVLAYDEARLIEALGQGAPFGQEAMRGRAFLEKVIQLQIPIPVASHDDIRRLLDAELRPVLADLGGAVDLAGDPRFEQLVNDVLPGPVLTTPRDIKRMVGHVRALAPMIGGYVDLGDIAGFCALMTKAPDLAASVRAMPERYVLDPDTDDELRRRLEASAYDMADGDDAHVELTHVSAGIAQLHRFLFPAQVAPGEICQIAKNRICFQRPLMTVLRLGAMPDAPPVEYGRDAYSDLLSADRETVSLTLLEAVRDGQADPLLATLAETYPLARNVADETFWSGVLDALIALQAGTAPAASDMARIVDLLAHLFERRAASAAGFPAGAILSAFVAEGEWSLSSTLLRPCWARARLTRQHGVDSQAPASLEPEEARNLAFQFAMHARTAHIKGEFLPGLLSLAPILLLIDMAVWDTQWQSGVQQIVVNDPAASGSRLLDLMFRDGDAVDARLRGRIVGNEELLGHLEQLWQSTRRASQAAQ